MIERLRVRVSEGEFSSPALTFCADSYSVSVPPRVTAGAHKRPRSFCRKCRWLHRNTHVIFDLNPTKSEWIDYSIMSRHSTRTYQGNELTRNSSGNAQPQSSQFAEPLKSDPGLNSGISVRELMSTHTHKKVGRERIIKPSSQISAR